jgi:hypothetical protein
MTGSSDILQRFRPAGTPGAAAPAGVPVDRVAEAVAELEPVLSLLADTQAEAAQIRARAQRDADQLRAQALDRAAARVVAARRHAAADRADAAVRARRAAEDEAAAVLAAAQRAAEEVRQRGVERMPAFLGRVLDATRSALRSGESA